ncbi:MAG: enoyl-CoA hydratase-related protein [Candidatus Hermodarchaeia archaeon]|jgi:enoyl-CoA hydratase/carnithine racemase
MSKVELKKENQIAIITINNPPANALDPEVFNTLQKLFTELDQDDTKVIILTGAGEKFFVGGADIKQFIGLDGKAAEKLARKGQEFTLFLEQHSKVIIVAVNGYALGGGMEIARTNRNQTRYHPRMGRYPTPSTLDGTPTRPRTYSYW